VSVDFAKLQEIFLAAVERRHPGDRQDYLDLACAGDTEMRRQVDLLLKAHQEAGSVRVAVADDRPTGAYDVVTEIPGTVIGSYKLLELIGEGGMGSVWMAQQTEPVKRLVALKLIKAGMDSKQVIARFEAERQALASIDHPNIARVLDGGTTATGRPYFVMDLVKGEPITRYCDERHLTPRQRLELFIPVCQAVQHAHQKGIIHRDLKPSNVLVALYDGKPVPKVIDFGVAKAAGQSLTEKTLVTGFGNIVGTLEYMSPEQAEINQLDVDTRSDVYSLGVLLYELLTGSPPFSRQELTQAGMLEMLRVIREDEPTKPSTKLSASEGLPTLAAKRGTEPAKLTKLVRGELDWIVMKALEKDRNRRYETANSFAMDVQRYLADEAVQACPASAWYRFGKFARRNKGALAVAGLVLFSLALLGIAIVWAVRDRAVRQAKAAGQVELIMTEATRLEREQKWPEALAEARRAQAAAAGGEAEAATLLRVRELQKGLEFMGRLELIRMQHVTMSEGSFSEAAVDQEYARAFRDYGVDVNELAIESSIDRLKARPALAIALAAALDDWAMARLQVSRGNASGWKRLLAVASGIDPEPSRDSFRSTWGKPPTTEVLAELRRLSSSIDVRAQHPATLEILARSLRRWIHSDSDLRPLRAVQHVYSGDFWINLELGFELSKLKDYEGAIRFYTAAVSIRPNSTVARTNLGSVLRKAGKLDEAVAEFRRAVELDSRFAVAHSNLGSGLANQGKFDEAAAECRRAIELKPNYAMAYGNPGTALDGQGKPEQAIGAYRKAIELEPKYARAHHNLGSALMKQGKLDEAAAARRRAIELDAKYAPAHSNLGLALTKQGRLDEAVAACRAAVKLAPKFASAHSILGSALMEQGKLDEAVAAYCKAIELDPKHAPAHANLGSALMELGKLDEAVTACRTASVIDPKSAPIHNALGIALFRRSMSAEAAEAHRKAIEIDPKLTDAHVNLGHALKADGKLDEAIEAYRKGIEIDQKNANAYNGMGLCLTEQGKIGDAMAAYRDAIRLAPDDARPRENIALLLITGPDPKFRDPQRAVEHARGAVALRPQRAEASQVLGWAQYRAGAWRESIEALEQSCKLQAGGTDDCGQWIVLAPAHAKLAAQRGLPEKECERHKAEARRWYEQAEKQIDGRWRIRPDRDLGKAIWDFRVEARALMGGMESNT
jgi:tetratricopeptide (TPR) repeat protein